MSVEVLVERRDEANEPAPIDIGEWRQLLEADPQLRARADDRLGDRFSKTRFD